MSWPKDHKQATRQRIVEAAAAAFRQRGIANVGVAEIMRRAGLTHGGFYAHFASKDDLLAAALDHAAAQVTSMLETSVKKSPGVDQLLTMALAYLSPPHLAHPERGCPVAALGPEVARAGKKVQQTLAAAIRARLSQLAGLISSSVPLEKRRQRAAGAVACMVGGLVLARALKESDAEQLLKDCQAFLRDALANSDVEATTLNDQTERPQD
jgi:TetR/AcrR family transcriptional regulator, transcriptional repressor for nem operon